MIKVKRIHENAKIPTRKGDINKSAFIDLSVADVEVISKRFGTTGSNSMGKAYFFKGDIVILHTGLAMELPEGTYGELLPRSSTFKKTGLIMTNSMGIIDHDYCGDTDEWMAMMYATRDGYIEIGQDYLQFRVVGNMENYEIAHAIELGKVSRGGYGSTDKEVVNG